ncbi:hypothetical protein [Mucilaginibacter sp.]|jgi:hypothetical protein|uniref:hypothetical protein n=1 Tax=Mucilaginibacter sp. TaxID=1882438 RepID=UPI002BCEA196|nr:hypothetical protein [Mucilaginibacter sp.]HTI59333.1 hypothetical protein [Mucilaginibacter sp.]
MMKYLFTLILSALAITQGFSQGCSDAGFCSLGVLKNYTESPAHHTLSIGSSYGLGEGSTSTINPYLEYGVKSNEHFSYSTKITATYATGFLGSVFDAGDVYGSATYSSKTNSGNSLNFIGGVKIPLTTSNDKNRAGKPLSLDYQSSIGSYDLIGGINYIVHQKWEFDAGVQVPVYQHNKSTFFPDDYTDPRAAKFAPTSNFRRNSDVLARVGYYIRFNDFSLKPNVLGVYHLGTDSYEDRLGQRQGITGSKGITINGALTAVKTFKNKSALELIAATPFAVRKIRPDGLTRDLVINVQYSIAW